MMNNRHELISIIIPVHNVDGYLPASVESVLSQTYPTLEIILVDDDSTDNSGTLCDEYAKKDSRVKVIHKHCGSASRARNAGLDIATGEYIGFMDSDDLMAVDAVEKLHKAFLRDTGVTCIGYDEFNDDTPADIHPGCANNTDNIVVYKSFDALRAMILASKMPRSVWAKLYHRDVLRDVRFIDRKVAEDVYFNYIASVNAHKSGRKWIYLPGVGYHYRIRSGSVMRSDAVRCEEDTISVLESIHVDSKKYSAGLADEIQNSIYMRYASANAIILKEKKSKDTVYKRYHSALKAIPLRKFTRQSRSFKEKIQIMVYISMLKYMPCLYSMLFKK